MLRVTPVDGTVFLLETQSKGYWGKCENEIHVMSLARAWNRRRESWKKMVHASVVHTNMLDSTCLCLNSYFLGPLERFTIPPFRARQDRSMQCDN